MGPDEFCGHREGQTTMAFPNFEGKHAHDAFFSAKEMLEHRRAEGNLPDFEIPEAVIFCYQSSLYKHVLARHDARRVDVFGGEFYLLTDTGSRIGFCAKFGIGAPVVTALLEEMVAMGIQRFMSIGTAGALAKGLEIGDVVVCDRAIRDEGVSHHYLPPAKHAHADSELTDRLERALHETGFTPRRGTSWTIDAPYRETAAEARHYQSEGVLTVEMEAAALFAVADYLKVPLAAAFTISDSLADLEWAPHFSSDLTRDGLEKLYRVALDVLLA
jgi:uridine phosphorylase